MNYKKCNGCGNNKSLSDFYKSKKKVYYLCKECKCSYARKRKFGRNKEYFIELYGKNCGICSKELPKRFCIDHDHKTGEVRGLLCNKCNTGIGVLGDTIEIVEKALAYLKKK